MDPRAGGVAEAVRQIGAALVRAGHETEVVTTDAPAAEWLGKLPFTAHGLGPGKGGVYQYAPGLTEFLRGRREEFDCVLSHGMWQYHGFATWRAWRGARGLRFVFAHGMLDPWFKRTYPKKHLKKWLYWPWAEYRVLRSARAVFFTCEEERRLARESFWLYRVNEAVNALGIEEPPGGKAEGRRQKVEGREEGERLGAIHPASDLEEAERQKAAFLEKFPELRGRRIVLFLGRLVVKKGSDLLLRAFAELAGKPEDAVLVMAGPDDEVDPAFSRQLREATAGDAGFCWPGMLSGDLKWGALRAAEVFVLPSHQENFGLAVVEALACGTPVLISDKVNIWKEIVEDGAGMVGEDTEAGTRDLLARWFRLSPEERAGMGRRARLSFERRYQIDVATAALVQKLREYGVAEADPVH